MKHTFAILVLLTSIHEVSAQPLIAWTKIVGGPLGDAATAIEQMPDGGYIACGGIAPAWPGLVRLNCHGDTLWTRLLPLSGWGGPKDVKITSDGGFVVTGRSSPSHLAIVKTDSLGVAEWQFISPDTGTVQSNGEAICLASDGGYIACGSIHFPAYQPFADMFVVKVNAAGSQVWRRNYGSPTSSDHGGYDIMAVPGQGYLAVGSVDNPSWHPRAFAVKLQNNGSSPWSHEYGDESGYHGAYGCALAANGDYLLAGFERFYTGGHSWDYWVSRITTGGSVVWNYTFGFGNSSHEIAQAVCELPSGRILIAGSKGTGQYDNVGEGWILGLSSSGAQDWEWIMDSPGSDAFFDVETTLEGGAIACGTTNGFGDTDGDILLVKFCAETEGAGRPSVILDTPFAGAYRIHHQQGEIDTVIFSGFPSGALGWVSGNAATLWSVVPDGDGNDGDSIIFATDTPLAGGEIDTFWISRPEMRCAINWRTECRMDTLTISSATCDIVSFTGGQFGMHVELQLSVMNEANVERYEVWSRWRTGEDRSFHLSGSQQAANDSALHSYGWNSLPVRDEYLLKRIDLSACVLEYPDLLLVRGENLDAFAPAAIAGTYRMIAYPNPFNASIIISLDVSHAAISALEIRDLLGRHVAVLHDGMLEPGEYRFTFDASALPSGIYFARVEAGEFVQTQKLLLLK